MSVIVNESTPSDSERMVFYDRYFVGSDNVTTPITLEEVKEYGVEYIDDGSAPLRFFKVEAEWDNNTVIFQELDYAEDIIGFGYFKALKGNGSFNSRLLIAKYQSVQLSSNAQF